MPTKAAPKKPTKKTPAKEAPAKKKAAAGKASAKDSAAAKAPAKKKAPSGSAAKKAPAKKKATGRSPAQANITTEFRNFVPYTPKRGEEYMSDGQREHFMYLLRKWKSELMEEVDRTVTHMKDEAANFPDPADRATQEEEFSLELRTRDRERKLIKKIDATIERIEQDDYGFCDACGVEIGIKRLEARPTATLCIDCKTIDEIKERQERG
jgi:DnaK suppressor protein